MLKQKLPKFLFDTHITIKGSKNIDENGEIIFDEYKGKCMYKTTCKRIFTDGKVNYADETKIIINDNLNFDCYGGKVYMNNKVLTIMSTYKDDIYTVIICN
jgi:hypothetical protein